MLIFQGVFSKKQGLTKYYNITGQHEYNTLIEAIT